ncbi:copia protein [Tanacetum coccineum]
MASNEETNAAGTDTRPPMLVESDYDSWKIRNTWPSSKPNALRYGNHPGMGPTPHPMSLLLCQHKGRYNTSSNNLIKQLLAKEIWDNVEMLMQGSDLYASQSIQPHAKRLSRKQEQSTSIVDPLAYVAHTTSAPALSSPSTPSPQPTAQAPKDALWPSRGKKVICYNCRGEGHVARQCKEPKRKMDSQYFKDKALLMEAKEKGDVLDAEAEAFLADVEAPHL